MDKNTLNYLEIAIVEHCNLNCKGCSHFSPLVKNKEYVGKDEFEKDIRRMKELFPDIIRIRILGGEPLLNPDLADILRSVRYYYPYAEISVVTNGLLIPKLEKEVLQSLKKTHIGFDISQYKPTSMVRDSIEAILVEHNISYEFTEKIETFRKRVSLKGEEDVVQSYEACNCKKCKYLFRGLLSGCPAPNVVRIFDATFGTKLHEESDVIPIHDTTMSADEIYKKITSPLKSCRYCSETELFLWETRVGESSINDWVIMEKE